MRDYLTGEAGFKVSKMWRFTIESDLPNKTYHAYFISEENGYAYADALEGFEIYSPEHRNNTCGFSGAIGRDRITAIRPPEVET